jgi:protoporphyrin/coproporphyrin ferrochelatase
MELMKRAIVLMNLGSPDSTEVKDVKRYLDEFLMDKRVIDKPWLYRALLVKGIIVPLRSPNSAKAYKTIWTEKGSPLIVISRQLRDALKKEIDDPVVIAMRYGNPSPMQAFNELLKKDPGLEEVILVPLYPHYAMSSFETAVEYAKEQHLKGNYSFKLTILKPFYNNPDYINALSESITLFLDKEYDQLIFSYHGIPERHILKSDITGSHCLKSADCCDIQSPAHQFCYRHQCWTTSKLVAQKLSIPDGKWSMSFQSRLGSDEWLKPYTVTQLKEFPKQGIKKLLVVCPAFVSDCLETLEEMGIEGKELFLNSGGESFDLIPCLNVHPLWVSTLAKMVNGQRSLVNA